MSVNKITDTLTCITENGFNSYKIADGTHRIIIGCLPAEASDTYVREASDADAVIMLTSKPQLAGSLDALLEEAPDITVCGSAACLRNLKEITGRELQEQLIKDSSELYGLHFIATPNMHWPDTVMAIYGDVLFSGEAFSGFDGSAVGLKRFYDSTLAVNRSFVHNTTERLMGMGIRVICPSYGLTCPQGTECVSAVSDEVFAKYLKWSEQPKRGERPRAAIVYASTSGYTRLLAQRAAEALTACDTVMVDVYADNGGAEAINNADIMLIGTHTINRNAPKEIWDAVTGIDMINKRGMPYVVFGSHGWGGDGVRIIDKTLRAMGMRCAARAIDAILKPTEKELLQMDEAVKTLLSAIEP